MQLSAVNFCFVDVCRNKSYRTCLMYVFDPHSLHCQATFLNVDPSNVRADGVDSLDAVTRNKLLMDNKCVLVAPPIPACCRMFAVCLSEVLRNLTEVQTVLFSHFLFEVSDIFYKPRV